MTHPVIAAFVIAIVMTSGYGLLEWLLWPPSDETIADHIAYEMQENQP